MKLYCVYNMTIGLKPNSTSKSSFFLLNVNGTMIKIDINKAITLIILSNLFYPF